jgi:peptidoglycan/LPS O-acetylase OafA/YrhL
MDNEDKTIHTFNSLRFIFFLFIFVHHCYNYVNIPILRQYELAVSVFIILSGFLNGYIYKNKYSKFSFIEIIKFIKKRIKRMYPLHIVMFLVCISLSGIFSFTNINELILFIKKAICNLLFIQSWINNEKFYFSFNGVTWFLSVYFFLTLLTIPMLVLIDKINKIKLSKIIQLFISIVLFLVSCIWVYIVNKEKLDVNYYLYIFPIARIPEYFIGMIFGNIFKNVKISFKFDKIIFTILEIISVVILLVLVLHMDQISNSLLFISQYLNGWIIPVIIVLLVFLYQKGFISFLLKLKYLDYLGQISMFLFMIHQPIIRLVRNAPSVIYHKHLIALYMLILTIIIGSYINKIVQTKKNN